MNAEIYFPRNGKAFGQTAEKSFENTVKKLNSMNVNIIYKTEVNLTEDSIVEALKVSESGEEKIGIIFIADVLTEDDPEKAKSFFESIGILSKVRRIETECKDPEAEEKAPESTEDKETKKKKKSKDKRSKSSSAQAEEPEDIGGLIDISGGEVTIEKKKLFVYAAEYNNKLVAILPCHEVLDTSFNEVIYTAAKKLVAPKKKASFWKRFIPCGGDRPIDVIRKIILLLAICTFLVSSAILIKIVIIEPAQNRQTTDEIRGLLVSTTDGEDPTEKKPKDGSDGVLADFAKLLETNPDTVGWITVPNTVIDYVVVKPQGDEDAEYYLHRDFYGNDSKYGTIFMDYRSDLDSKNMILHGHHMQDGSMFANLVQYDSLDFYKTAAVFDFNTLYEKSKWKIISVFKTNTLEEHGPFFNYLRGSFSSDYDFLNFAYELRVRSIIDCPVTLNENDTIVTLSTCTYDMEDFRYVVVARKVRDGEDAGVDLKKAKLNPNPVYPQGWYNWFGGTRPEVTSFQEALNAGEITWYDGDGKWSEKDDEELKKQLIEGKDNATSKLNDAYDPSLYADVQVAEIKAIIAKYEELFAAAERPSEINDLYAQALNEISKVKTREQVESDLEISKKKSEEEASNEASEKALNEAKTEAIAELNNTVAGVEYRLAQASIVNELIAEYTGYINNAETVKEVKELKAEGVSQLKKVKTNAQLNAEESRAQESSRKAAEESSRKAAEESSRRAAEESSRRAEESRLAEESAAAQLAAYQENAVSALEIYLDPSQYSEDIQAAMQAVITQYSADIRSASSESAVDSLLNEAKVQLETLAESQQQESSEEESSEEESDEV